MLNRNRPQKSSTESRQQNYRMQYGKWRTQNTKKFDMEQKIKTETAKIEHGIEATELQNTICQMKNTELKNA